MPFTMKIQPIDSVTPDVLPEPVKPVAKSRFKRLFERQFLRTCSTEKTEVEEPQVNKDVSNGPVEVEPSSVCLANMVQNFLEERDERHGRNRCNCFNGNCSDSSEDETDAYVDVDTLKSLVQCASVAERNLLADTARIVEKNKNCKRKDDLCRRVVTEGLVKLGYDASNCKSRWEKTPSYPAGEYDYVAVIVEGERLLVDIDFRSEFEIARPTKIYKSLLQTLPYIFVGKPERLKKIISIVTEAAKQSLRKKGMHVPPWRKGDYVKAKWFSPYTRTTQANAHELSSDPKSDKPQALVEASELKPKDVEKNSMDDIQLDSFFAMSESSCEEDKATKLKDGEIEVTKPRSPPFGLKARPGGLASIMQMEP